MNEYTVGIIGYGYVATSRHIPSYKKDKRTKIVSIVGPNKREAKTISERMGIPLYFNNLDEMLDLNLDIVSVCTPPGTHAEIAIKALKKGCNVLVEKPTAMNTNEVNNMIQASKQYNKSLCVCHNFLFSRSMQKVDEMLINDEIGKVQNISAIQLSSTKRKLPEWYHSLPGKLFFDEVPHMIYLMKKFLPDLDIKDISEVHLTRDYPSNNFYVNFSSNTIFATLKMIFNAPCSEWKVIVVGTKKVILIDLFRDSLITLSEERSHSPLSVLYSSLNYISQNIWTNFNSGIRLLTRNLLFGHDILIRKFINSIDTKTEPPVTPEQGKKTIEIMEQIIEKLRLHADMNHDDNFYSVKI